MKTEGMQPNISSIGLSLCVLCVAAGAIVRVVFDLRWAPAGLIVLGAYLLFAIRVADQWEKVAVLRFGRYRGLRGPGLFHIVPVMETVSRFVDQRVRVANVSAESTLTRDTVPVNVDAIVFWMVWDPEKSILEVQDFQQAIALSAQTALRESIGRHELHQMVAEREMLGQELQRILDGKTNPWGLRCNRWRSATCRSPRPCRMPCHAKRRPSASGAPAPSWAWRKPRSRKVSGGRRSLTSTIPSHYICGP